MEMLEQQLKCPKGEKGIALGEQMDRSNIGMTKSAIDILELIDGDRLLELGHGNAGHLSYIFDKSPNVNYTGLELSKTMFEEAKKKNKEYTTLGKAEFLLYDGEVLPFDSNSFSKIVTVNTLYFWTSPVDLLTELARVCQAGGSLVVSFAEKSFMEKLPFVGDGFSLYDESSFLDLLKQSPFVLGNMDKKIEQVRSKSGDLVDRIYFNALLLKR